MMTIQAHVGKAYIRQRSSDHFLIKVKFEVRARQIRFSKHVAVS